MSDETLRRCKAYVEERPDLAWTDEGIDAEAAELHAFVEAEIGRRAGAGALEKTLALVLFFANDEDLEEVKQVLLAANPQLRAVRTTS